MAGATLTNYDDVLKEVYGPSIQEELSLRNVLTEWIDEDDSQQWTGREVTYPVHVGRNEGVGASGESALLPTAGVQSFALMKIPVKYNYGRIRMTKQIMASSEQSKGAFTRAMEYELKGMTRDLSNDRERQFFGDGYGILALVNGTTNLSATTWLPVDSPFGVTPTTNGTRFINPNMTVVCIGSSNSTVYGTFTVSSVSSDGTTIVVSATQDTTFTNNYRLVRYNSGVTAGTTNNYDNEVMGLLGMIDDGTYRNTLHNVNRTTYPVFKSTVISSVGQLSLDVIQRGVDAVDEIGGGNIASTGVMFCHHSVRREYLKLLQADRRYTGSDLRTPDGGTKNAALSTGGRITYGDIPWITAKHCPYGTLFGISKGQVKRYVQIRGEWADDDGSILKWVPDYDIWQAFYRIFDNLSCDRPNDGFRLDGITATVSIAHVY